MPKTLPSSLIVQKNLIASSAPWLILLDINLPDDNSFYLVNNNEDIVFESRTYQKFPFRISFGESTSSGEIPSFKLSVSNVTRIFQYYIEKYKGGVDSTVTIRIVNTADLEADYSSFTIELSILNTDIENLDWAVFTLGAPNPMTMEFLMFIFNPHHCNWVFDYKGPECGYAGDLTDCIGSLEDCRAHNNSVRFGGHPGLEAGGYRFA